MYSKTNRDRSVRFYTSQDFSRLCHERGFRKNTAGIPIFNENVLIVLTTLINKIIIDKTVEFKHLCEV